MDEKPIEIENRMVLLKQIPVFSTLDKKGLSALAALLVERKTRAQEALFKKGDSGESMYILAEGEVRVHDGNHVIARLKAGEVFGEYALLDTEKRSASVTTETVSRILILDRKALMPFLSQYPEIVLSMLQLQVKRMRDMNLLEEKLSRSYLKITKQKQEIETQHEAIKDQAAQLELKNQSLIALNSQKKQLLSVIIHGLKNPMTSVQTMAELLDECQQLGDEEREYVEILKKSLARMNQVINDLIQSNQEETTQLQRKLPVQISKALNEALSLHIEGLENKQIRFSLKESKSFVILHKSYLMQLLDKLIEWILIEIKPKTTLDIVIERQETVHINFTFQHQGALSAQNSKVIRSNAIFEIRHEQLEIISFIQKLKELCGFTISLNQTTDKFYDLQIDLNQSFE